MTLSESLRAGYSTRMEIPLPVQIEYKRALSAMKTCSRKQFASAFTLVPTLRGRVRAFTLIEMLTVLGMIVILLSAVIPAVTSLSKANGRKAAMANLLGGIEQARAEAINTSQASYVVFPTFGAGTAQSTLDRYNYKSYAIFEDNAANPGSVNPAPTFGFTPDTGTTPAFPCLKFNSNGEVEAPAANVLLGVFEGYVSNGSEVATSGKDANGNPAAVEYIAVAQFTGRAEPADAVATPTPTP